MQGKLAAFAHEAAQYCTIWQPYFGSAASEPGFTSWRYLKPGNSRDLLAAEARRFRTHPRVCWDENPFCNPKKTRSRLHLPAAWPIELRFQRKPAALAVLQDPHHSIVATLRVAHRCERFNCSQCKRQQQLHAGATARGAVTTPHCCARNLARCCASPSPRRCCRPAAASTLRHDRATR